MSRFNLHLPPLKEWSQQSPMRIYSAARFNVKTISIIKNLNVTNNLKKFLIHCDINNLEKYIKNKKHHSNYRKQSEDVDKNQLSLFFNLVGINADFV